jgi:hypothetical protein
MEFGRTTSTADRIGVARRSTTWHGVVVVARESTLQRSGTAEASHFPARSPVLAPRAELPRGQWPGGPAARGREGRRPDFS